jgi:hypothetical protein
MKDSRIYNDIIVISDPQKAFEDKIDVDMRRRKKALPSKIALMVLALFVLAGGVSYIMHKCGMLDYAYCIAIWCVTPFPAILWFALWAGTDYIPYSANTRYWLITNKSNVHKMHITKSRGGRYYWPAHLNIIIHNAKGEPVEKSVDIGYVSHYCDDIKQDVVDFTLNQEEGVWFQPADRKRDEMERSITSMKRVVKYYQEGNYDEYFDEDEDED